MQNEKSKITAYVLWLMIGAFGAHRFYLGRIKSGIALALCFITAMVTYGMGTYLLLQRIQDDSQTIDFTQWNAPYLLLSGLGTILFLIWGIWLLLDLYFIHVMMKKDVARAPIGVKQAVSVFKKGTADGI